MAECRLPRGVVLLANAVDHDCRNEARRYCRRAENGVALAEKHPRVHRNSPDRSSDLTRQPLRTPIANLCLSPAPTDAPKHSAFSVPNRHQTNHHPARPSIGAVLLGSLRHGNVFNRSKTHGADSPQSDWFQTRRVTPQMSIGCRVKRLMDSGRSNQEGVTSIDCKGTVFKLRRVEHHCAFEC